MRRPLCLGLYPGFITTNATGISPSLTSICPTGAQRLMPGWLKQASSTVPGSILCPLRMIRSFCRPVRFCWFGFLISIVSQGRHIPAAPLRRSFCLGVIAAMHAASVVRKSSQIFTPNRASKIVGQGERRRRLTRRFPETNRKCGRYGRHVGRNGRRNGNLFTIDNLPNMPCQRSYGTTVFGKNGRVNSMLER
ncbi:hypothetical protein ABIB95_007747 [Bradyrhizobium sp. LA2.1]